MKSQTNQTACDVIIVGGGLAGCTTAYHLNQLGFHVRLIEQKRYPHHKLCGEMLSPEARKSFERMQVWGKIESLKPAAIKHVRVTTSRGASYCGQMPGTALGLSRYQLDSTLWNHCQSSGVETIEGFKVQQIDGDLKSGFVLSGVRRDRVQTVFHTRCVIGAFGKRSNLDRVLQRRFRTQRHDYVAFKAHFEGIDLQQSVELHSFQGGYCGLCHIESNAINLCTLVKASVFRRVGSNRQRLFDEVLSTNPMLQTHLQMARCISPKFLSIGQIAFTTKSPWENDILMVGDSAVLIAPLCGDGMAMAMRSAEGGVSFVTDYLRGNTSRPDLKEAYCQWWNQEFTSRIRWGRLLQSTLFRPILASGTVGLLSRLPSLAQFLIQQTREA